MTRLASRPRHSVEAFSFALALRRSDAPSFPAALDCRGIGRLLHREGAKRACELLCALGHSSFPISPLFVRMGDYDIGRAFSVW
jgi:hypothetical protein